MKKPTPAASQRVLLGQITTVHGVRGDVVVRSFTANPESIASYGGLETAGGKPLPKLTVVRVTARGLIARLAGITSRTAAEAYRGTELWIDRARLPAAGAGEYYHADLVGLEAVAPDGTTLGHVIAVENFGAGDLLEIKLKGSNVTEYIPFTGACVPDVDIPARRLTLVRPEMLEGDRAEELAAQAQDEGEPT